MNYWGEPERAPLRRVECSQSIYYDGTFVTRAPLYNNLHSVRNIAMLVRDIYGKSARTSLAINKGRMREVNVMPRV